MKKILKQFIAFLIFSMHFNIIGLPFFQILQKSKPSYKNYINIFNIPTNLPGL